jgi:hypothetical protein
MKVVGLLPIPQRGYSRHGFRVEVLDRTSVSCVPLKKVVEEVSRKPVPGNTENKFELVLRSDRQIILNNDLKLGPQELQWLKVAVACMVIRQHKRCPL